MFGGDKFVVRIVTEVLDEVYQERIPELVLGEEDNVCAFACQVPDDGLAYAARAALRCFSANRS